MSKHEDRARQDLEKYLEIFKGCKTEADAKKFIKENLYKLSITKGCIAAYITVFHKEEDNSWFKKAAYVKENKYAYTNCVDAEGNIIYTKKTNKKTGKAIPKTKKVAIAGEQVVYKHNLARTAFLEKYNIEVKDTGFKAKEKRTEKQFDVFEGLF